MTVSYFLIIVSGLIYGVALPGKPTYLEVLLFVVATAVGAIVRKSAAS